MKFLKKYWFVFVFLILTIFLFKDFVFKGLLPIPSDTIVGGYYPWRDEVWQERTAGFPIKNFAIRDITRQLYPWRWYSIKELKNLRMPLWNPYNFTGAPHLANVFTASFYPLNLLFFILPFWLGWSLQVFLQPFLVGLTTFLFLKNLKLKNIAAFFGSLVFAFSSILMIRLEFGMVGQTALWLPLALLAIDRFFQSKKWRWWFLAVFSLSLSFLAGYLQVTIYTYLLFFLYSLYRFLKIKDKKTFIFLFLAPLTAFLLSGIQTIPLFDLVLKSSRIANYGAEVFFASEFFLPWQRLITFLAPDFFGNDATGNFWGETSYYEFTGYIGIIALFFVFYSLTHLKKKKDILFWWLITVLTFLFLLPTSLAKLPYQLGIPGFSVLIPARMIFVINFGWSVLAAFGLNIFWGEKKESQLKERVFKISFFWFFIFIFVWLSLFFGRLFLPKWQENFSVSLRNLILPTFYVLLMFIFLTFYLGIKKRKFRLIILVLLSLVLFFDLSRQALKYNPFTPKETLFPTTQALDFLKSQQEKDGPFRIQITNQELMTTNFNLFYGLEMVDGYDSFHSRRFDELAAAANFEDPQKRFESLGRSVFLSNHCSPLFDLMNVRYILSLEEIQHPNLELVFEKGKTKIYEDVKAYPRIYLSSNVEIIKDDEEILNKMFDFSQKGERKVILEKEIDFQNYPLEETALAEIEENKNQIVKIRTQSLQRAILVFSDAYDSGWKAWIDGQPTKVYRANYNFRAVVVPAGEHQVVFQYQPLSFTIGLYTSLGTLVFLILGVIIFKRKQ